MKTKLILLMSALFALFMPVSHAGAIVVKPGNFDHFVLEVPERIVAGESFSIKASAYDLQNNLIVNFSETKKEFNMSVSGSAAVQPSNLSSEAFRGGVAQISIIDKKAETISFSIYQTGRNVPLISREMIVLPNKLDHFSIDAQTQAIAGDPFAIKIIAKDSFDNTASNAKISGKNVRVVSSGSAPFRIVGAGIPDFRDGAASIELAAESVGIAAVEVQETLSGSRGRSGNIEIRPAALASFDLRAPSEITAGESFEITMAAFDRFGNPISDYSSTGNGIMLRAAGSSKIEPSFIKPAEFKDNKVVVRAVYEKAEEMTIIATEKDKTQGGKSNAIQVHPAMADHFAVITPDEAVSGKPFKVKIEAFDRFNNKVGDYNLKGSSVTLKTTGTGMLSPSAVSPSDFINGTANVEVVYDKAESFDITAVMQPGKIGEEAAKDRQLEEKVLKAVKKTDKTKKTPVEKKEALETPGETKKELEEPIKEGRPEEFKEVKAEMPKREVRGAAASINLENISLLEAKEKATLVLTLAAPVEGNVQYKEEIESKQGKRWLKIRLKPVLRKTEKSLKFKSAFIGDIAVEEDSSEPSTVDVFIEIVPEKIMLAVTQLNNSIVVTLTKL